eukprot:m.24018 g.24018  ORF g.24018 m.24018 type:complete len:216 (+) comp11133_c0_seq2:954-1601(+)
MDFSWASTASWETNASFMKMTFAFHSLCAGPVLRKARQPIPSSSMLMWPRPLWNWPRALLPLLWMAFRLHLCCMDRSPASGAKTSWWTITAKAESLCFPALLLWRLLRPRVARFSFSFFFPLRCNLYVCPIPSQQNFHEIDSKNNTYTCTRTFSPENSMYCEFADNENFHEYYDIDKDPYQLDNIYDTLPQDKKAQMAQHLQSLRQCSGPSCHQL